MKTCRRFLHPDLLTPAERLERFAEVLAAACARRAHGAQPDTQRAQSASSPDVGPRPDTEGLARDPNACYTKVYTYMPREER